MVKMYRTQWTIYSLVLAIQFGKKEDGIVVHIGIIISSLFHGVAIPKHYEIQFTIVLKMLVVKFQAYK